MRACKEQHQINIHTLVTPCISVFKPPNLFKINVPHVYM